MSSTSLILPQDRAGANVVSNNDVPDDPIHIAQVIISDDGNQQIIQHVGTFSHNIPKGYQARWEKTNEYDFDGDVTINHTRTIHLHKGTWKRISKNAVCGAWQSRRKVKGERWIAWYDDEPYAGVDYRVCPQCWEIANGRGES